MPDCHFNFEFLSDECRIVSRPSHIPFLDACAMVPVAAVVMSIWEKLVSAFALPSNQLGEHPYMTAAKYLVFFIRLSDAVNQ